MDKQFLIKQTRAKLAVAKNSEEELLKRSKEINAEFENLSSELDSLEDSVDEEKLADVEKRAEELTAEEDETKRKLEEVSRLISELSETLKKFTEEVEKVEAETETIEEKEQAEKSTDTERKERTMNKEVETRSERIRNIEQDENKAFLRSIVSIVKREAPAEVLKGTEFLIPQYFVNRINQKIGNYSKLYDKVTVLRVGTPSRIVYNAGGFKAVWTEKCASLTEMKGAEIKTVDLDAYKLGGYVSLCRPLIETDTYVSIADYIENEIARAMAKELDNAILNGTGEKQPTGIVKALESQNDQKVTANSVLALLGAFAKIGGDDVEIDSTLAVMSRETFYTHILPETYGKNHAGALVVANEDSFVLPNGAKVVLSDKTAKDSVVIGDFKNGYVLAERQAVRLEKSEHVKFIEDNTVFKGTALYDGNILNPKYFAIVTMQAPKAVPSRGDH